MATMKVSLAMLPHIFQLPSDVRIKKAVVDEHDGCLILEVSGDSVPDATMVDVIFRNVVVDGVSHTAFEEFKVVE